MNPVKAAAHAQAIGWTGHWLDNPALDPDTLDDTDRRAYWERRKAALVLATSVSAEVALTAQAAERIRNNRRLARSRLGLPQARPVTEVSRQQAGLPLLDGADPVQVLADETPRLILPEGLVGLDETADIDEAAWDALKAGIVGREDEIVPADAPQAASVDEILAIPAEEGELSDRDILMSLRRKGAAVKIKGKSPAPTVTRQPVFNPIDALRTQHRLYNATRMHPLAHACKIGVVCLMTGQLPPTAVAPGSLAA